MGLWKERQGFGWVMGPLANKVWIQPRSLAGSAPRPCGHDDLGKNLQPQVVEASGAAQQASFRKQQQAGRSSRASDKPYAGRRTDFRDQKSRDFSGEIFLERNSNSSER